MLPPQRPLRTVRPERAVAPAVAAAAITPPLHAYSLFPATATVALSAATALSAAITPPLHAHSLFPATATAAQSEAAGPVAAAAAVAEALHAYSLEATAALAEPAATSTVTLPSSFSSSSSFCSAPPAFTIPAATAIAFPASGLQRALLRAVVQGGAAHAMRSPRVHWLRLSRLLQRRPVYKRGVRRGHRMGRSGGRLRHLVPRPPRAQRGGGAANPSAFSASGVPFK